jgi:hypothetical protein
MREDGLKKFLSKIGKGRRVVASLKKERIVTQAEVAHGVFNIGKAG